MKQLVFLLVLLPAFTFGQQKRDSIWAPMNFFIGEWRGEGGGEPGMGTYQRSYKSVLNGTAIEVRNMSKYAPTEKYPKGEVHEDYGNIFYDKARKTFLLRQLHVEGFANDYVLESISADKKTLTFVSEVIINIPKGWKARETYRILAPNEFEETFELAPPDKEFAIYTKVNFKRK